MLSELIDELEIALNVHGDMPAVLTYGCGCCSWDGDPRPRVSETWAHDDLPNETKALRLS